jgi:hypothetical protein
LLLFWGRTELWAGTLLVREWDGRLQRVIVLADGFAWKTENLTEASPRSVVASEN